MSSEAKRSMISWARSKRSILSQGPRSWTTMEDRLISQRRSSQMIIFQLRLLRCWCARLMWERRRRLTKPSNRLSTTSSRAMIILRRLLEHLCWIWLRSKRLIQRRERVRSWRRLTCYHSVRWWWTNKLKSLSINLSWSLKTIWSSKWNTED